MSELVALGIKAPRCLRAAVNSEHTLPYVRDQVRPIVIVRLRAEIRADEAEEGDASVFFSRSYYFSGCH